MINAHDAVDAAVAEIDRLRKVLKRRQSLQVWSAEEKSLIKATALSWFNNHRKQVQTGVVGDLLDASDTYYKALLSAADRAGSRTKYNSLLKSLRKELLDVREYTLTASQNNAEQTTADEPPKFDPLIADPRMRDILINRWLECRACLTAGASLAATVMMGGLLEALLLARINKEQNKTSIFTATTAPKDKSTGKTLPLKDWTLRHFIDVAHELNWISQSAKEVGEVLRDYRNYIHPYKEFSHGVRLREDDASLFWEISKGIARQVIRT
jgi:hypothetical protein